MNVTLEKLQLLRNVAEAAAEIYGPNDLPVCEIDSLGAVILYKDGKEAWSQTHTPWILYELKSMNQQLDMETSETHIRNAVGDCYFVHCPAKFGWARIIP